ncbi:MAG: NusG domain II-containing protein [Bacilli bacterium]|nr:NusG domain II-containing protein [Bacilli bacterium]
MKFNLVKNKIDYLISIIVILAILIMVVFSLTLKADKNSIVSIRYYNKIVYQMSLNKNEIFTLEKEKYPLLLDDLVIEVKNGKVRVVEEESPRHYCSILGFVDTKGTSIICAPNGVVITIEGQRDDDIDWVPGGVN